MKSILLITILLLSGSSAIGQQPNTATGTDSAQSAAHKYFTDTTLINQNGETMRFYTDLLQGKTVIINTFFSTCFYLLGILSADHAKSGKSARGLG